MASEKNHQIFVEYDWKTFMDACSEMFSTEFYGCEYVLLENYIDSYGLKPQTFIEFIKILASKVYFFYAFILWELIIHSIQLILKLKRIVKK